jgi:hypothetical protein
MAARGKRRGLWARGRGAEKPQIGLVDEGRCLQCLPRLFMGESGCRQLAQLVINKRKQLFGGLGIALIDLGEDTSYVGHVSRIASQKASCQEMLDVDWGGTKPGGQSPPY